MSTRKTRAPLRGWGENRPRASYLFVHLRPRHLLQVLQVGVEQVAAGQRDPQNPLDDVADGAVVGQPDLFCRVHEVAAAGKRSGQTCERGAISSPRTTRPHDERGVHLTWPTGSSSGPDPDSRRTLLLQWRTRSSPVSVKTEKTNTGLPRPDTSDPGKNRGEKHRRTILLSPSRSVASMGRSRLGFPTYMS